MNQHYCDEHTDEQHTNWEKFYRENPRPWRGDGKLPDLGLNQSTKVLELGCGNGKNIATLLRTGSEVIGLDFSESAVEYCKAKFGERASFLVADCCNIPLESETYDAIIATHVFEHLDINGSKSAASEITRLLLHGGKFFFRSFAVGDHRSGGEDSNVRGNGISYRYYTLEEMETLFPDLKLISAERLDETMRFGAVRVRIECIFQKQ